VRRKLVVFGYGRERLYTRERAKALARKITCELLTVITAVFVESDGSGALTLTWSFHRSIHLAICPEIRPVILR
jgi:hypothetical protein